MLASTRGRMIRTTSLRQILPVEILQQIFRYVAVLEEEFIIRIQSIRRGILRRRKLPFKQFRRMLMGPFQPMYDSYRQIRDQLPTRGLTRRQIGILTRRVLTLDRFGRHYQTPRMHGNHGLWSRLMGTYLGPYQRYFHILNRGNAPLLSGDTDRYIDSSAQETAYSDYYGGGTEWTRRVTSVFTRLKIWRRRAMNSNHRTGY